MRTKVDLTDGCAGLFLFALILPAMLVASTVMGAAAGWMVGWFFSDTILGIAGQLGLRHLAMWELGAFLGFVGAFFKGKS